MRNIAIMRNVAIIFLLFISIALYGEKIEVFEKIEFRGAKNLDKVGVIKRSRVKVTNKGIIIDVDSLKDVLDKEVYLKSKSISREGNTLVIDVSETYPIFMAMVVDEKQSIPLLFDDKMNIIETGLFFKTDMPIIIMDRNFYEDSNGYRIVTELFELLKRIRQDNGAFLDEIEEITLHSSEDLAVKLKRRSTIFTIKNDLTGFFRLEKTAAYLDLLSRYPESLDLRGNMALVR